MLMLGGRSVDVLERDSLCQVTLGRFVMASVKRSISYALGTVHLVLICRERLYL